MHFSIDRTVHTTAFDKPVVDHWLERKIAQPADGSTEKDRSDDRPLQRRARYRLSYIPLPNNICVSVYVCMCMYACMYVCMYECMCECICTYVRTCVCMYVCVFNNNVFPTQV